VTRPTMRVTRKACHWHDAGEVGGPAGGPARLHRTEGAPMAQGT
jgi:hypothetical protein